VAVLVGSVLNQSPNPSLPPSPVESRQPLSTKDKVELVFNTHLEPILNESWAARQLFEQLNGTSFKKSCLDLCKVKDEYTKAVASQSDSALEKMMKYSKDKMEMLNLFEAIGSKINKTPKEIEKEFETMIKDRNFLVKKLARGLFSQFQPQIGKVQAAVQEMVPKLSRIFDGRDED
jgi:hypothetical protein